MMDKGIKRFTRSRRAMESYGVRKIEIKLTHNKTAGKAPKGEIDVDWEKYRIPTM